MISKYRRFIVPFIIGMLAVLLILDLAFQGIVYSMLPESIQSIL